MRSRWFSCLYSVLPDNSFYAKQNGSFCWELGSVVPRFPLVKHYPFTLWPICFHCEFPRDVWSVDVGHHSEWMTIANVDVRYANRSSLLSIFFLFPPLFLASLCFCRYLQWPSYYIQLTFPSSLFHFFLSLLSFLLPSPPSPLLFSPSLRYIVKNN